MASYKVRRRYNKTSVLDTGTTSKRYYKYGTLPNVDIYGDGIIIEDGIVSGFGNECFLLTRPQQITKYTPTAENWEIVIKFKFTVSSHLQTLWYCAGVDYGSVILIDTAEKLSLRAGNSTSSYNVVNITGTTVFEEGKIYWIKAEFTGTAYNIYSSIDGVSWTLENTKTSSTKISMRGYERLGYYTSSKDYTFMGSIDLSGCYYKVNDKYLWRGIQPEIATENDYDYYEEYKVVSTYKE